jgi:peptide/nickel transport system permease protein
MRLQRLVAARFWLYRPLRARRSLRTRYLWRLVPVLLVLGLLLGVTMTLALPQGARPVWLAAAAGAAGASLSGLLRFRDEVRLGSQVRAFVPFYLAQVVVGGLLGGVIVVERVFGLPGLGGDTVQAITDNDLPMIQGVVLFAACFVIIANLLVDLACTALDPRVRHG